MPNYQYKCPICQQIEEVWQSDYEDRQHECKECKSYMNKMIGKSSFILVGSGFYKNDYKVK